MKGKIILFEDESDVRETIIEILTSNDYDVLPLLPDADLTRNLTNYEPDLILSDIMMPLKNGIELINDIKKNKQFADIPFIFLTAKSEYQDIRTGMNLGADDYILKPFKVKDLLKSVEVRIQKSKSIKEKMNHFSSSIAMYIPHELRTPLISLFGYTDMILSDYDSLTDYDILEFTKKVQLASRRLYRTIEKFILYSDLIAAEMDKSRNSRFIESKVSEISEIIKKISVETAMYFERENDIILKLEKCKCKISEKSLSAVLSQILENSIKYSESGSKIEIHGICQKNRYSITIKDNGIGMTKDQIKRITGFDKHNIEIQNIERKSIGLDIVRKLLTYLDSEFTIQSEVNKGTSVAINLKAAD